MATVQQTDRIGSYTLSDAVLVLALGMLGGIVNVIISSLPHPHFELWGARAPYAAFFVLAPVIAMLLIRKPGVALVAALIYGLIQTIAGGNPNNMVFGLTEGPGAELVFALFRYRRLDALSAFLAGGIGAKTLDNLWRLATASSGPMMGGMQAPQYAPWQQFVGGEILGLVVFGILSGLGGWALAHLIERTHVPERLRARWGHTARSQ